MTDLPPPHSLNYHFKLPKTLSTTQPITLNGSSSAGDLIDEYDDHSSPLSSVKENDVMSSERHLAENFHFIGGARGGNSTGGEKEKSESLSLEFPTLNKNHHHTPPTKDVFIFSYGCVVFWYVSKRVSCLGY